MELICVRAAALAPSCAWPSGPSAPPPRRPSTPRAPPCCSARSPHAKPPGVRAARAAVSLAKRLHAASALAALAQLATTQRPTSAGHQTPCAALASAVLRQVSPFALGLFADCAQSAAEDAVSAELVKALLVHFAHANAVGCAEQLLGALLPVLVALAPHASDSLRSLILK